MKTSKFKKIAWSVFVVLGAVFILLTAYKLVMRIANPSKLPTYFGYSSSFVISGSMEPVISAGDLVIFKTQDSYEINDVIAYYDEQDGVFVLHRIIGSSTDGFITKGDFNPDHDPVPVKFENIQGKVVLAIPNLKTYFDMFKGALILLFVQYTVKLIKECRNLKSKEGGKEADEEKV